MSLRKGLVGHWTMNDSDTSNGVLYDRSAYDNHGAINGSPTTGATGEVSEAYSFSGTKGDFVECDVSSISWNEQHTLTAWVKIDSDGAFSTSNFGGSILASGDFDTALFSSSLPEVRFFVLPDDASSATNIGTGITADTWHHVAGVRDSSNVAHLYVNGTEVATDAIGGTDAINSNTLYSGDNAGTGGDAFKGDIDDTRAYNRALSDSEISALYNMRSQRQQNSFITVDDFSRNNLDPYKLTNSPLNQISSTNPRNGQHHGQSNTDGSEKSMSFSLNGLSKYPNSGDDIYAYVYPTKPNDVLFFDWGIQGDTQTGAGSGFPEEGGYAAEIRFQSNELNVFVDSTKLKSGNFTSDGVDRWYYYKISWGNNGKQVASIEDPQDSSEYISLTFNDSQYNTGGIGWGMDNSRGNSSEAYWDYIFTT